MQLNFEQRIVDDIASKCSSANNCDLYRKVHILTNLYCCIDELCTTFDEVELLEMFGTYMKLRVQR